MQLSNLKAHISKKREMGWTHNVWHHMATYFQLLISLSQHSGSAGPLDSEFDQFSDFHQTSREDCFSKKDDDELDVQEAEQPRQVSSISV